MIAAGGTPSPKIFEFSRHNLFDYVIKKTVNSYMKPNPQSGDRRYQPKEMTLIDDVFRMGSVGSVMVTKLISLMGTEE